MANAQILVLLAGAVPADTIRTVVEAAARASGFTPSAWTYAQGADTALRDTTVPTMGTFTTGPFLGKGFNLSTPLPTATPTSQVQWTAFRMNLLSGPDQGTTGATDAALAATSSAVHAGLRNIIGWASRGASNTISWDRGVPASIVLPEAGGGSGGGLLVGFIAVAAVAAMASRGTARQKAAMGGTEPKYHVIVVRDSGTRIRMTSSPVTRREGRTIISKLTPPSKSRAVLEAAR